MPNWCNSSIRVKGNPKDIENFCKLFVFSEDEEKDIKKIYFARSFTFMKWNDFKKEYLGKSIAEFSVDFAWSVTSCLINGYPQKTPKTCKTLIWACKKYKVDVVIDSEEGGMGFEEHIECNKNGKLIEKCFKMPSYKCKKCNNIQTIPSSYSSEDLKDVECCECDGCDWEVDNE